MKHFTKSFLVLLAALFSFSMAFAETGTETEANQRNGNKNTTAEGQSYTIDGTYIAGTGSSSASPMTSKGLKFRTAQNGGTLEFTVRENYTITKLYMAAIGNYVADDNSLPYVKVSKVEVDGTEVEFEGGEFPEKGASAAGELTVDNISATQKIVLYFDNSNASAGTQLNASWSIDWSRPDATQPTITVTPKTLALVPGASSKLSVHVDPASFTTLWASSDETVATVTEDGTVTAIAPGTATISNQWDNDASVAGAAVVTVAEFDPSAYTVTSYDFTTMGDVSLTLSEEAAGAIWNEGNNKANNVFFCTNDGLENIAVQAALSGGKGWSIIDGQGLVLASGAGRCAAVGNLKASQIVEIIYTGNSFYTGSREDAVRKDDGALKTALNEGIGRAIYKMDEDGLLGFELEKGKAVTQINIYSSNSVVEDVYTVAGNSTAIFGTEWDAANTANDMVKGDDGIYTKVYEGVELTNDYVVEYKIMKNHSWDENWGYNGNNATYKVWEGDAKYDVTFTFNPETKAVACDMQKQTVVVEPFDVEKIAINPAARSTVESLQNFTLTFGGQAVTVNAEAKPTLNQGETVVATGAIALNADGSVAITFAEAVTAPGNYTLEIPSGAILYNGAAIDPLSFIYSIAGGADFVIDPAEGEVASLSTFTITFNNYMVEEGENMKAYLFNTETEAESHANVYVTGGGKSLYVSLDEEVTAPGEYQLNIEGVKRMDTEAGVELIFTYTVKDATAIDQNYYILGEFWGWDNPKQMEATETENVYTLVIDATVEAKKYEYKLRQGDNWDGYQLPASGNNEYTFTEAGDYTLTFTANVAEHTLTLDAVKKNMPNYYAFNGTAYVIDAESGLMMAAGHDYGTRGIVNELGLDLIFTTNEATGKVTIDSRVQRDDSNHFLGSNLYMDSQAYEWGLLYQDFGFYIVNADGQYISIDRDDNLTLSDTPHEWILVTPEGVLEQRLGELAEATADSPKDATWLISGANFNRADQRNNAWQVSDDCTNRNLNGGAQTNMCAESWHSVFTISQVLANAPAGVYALTAQGFYRQDGSDEYNKPYFFANDERGYLPLMANGENNMTDASNSFTAGKYTIEPIFVEVTEAGALTVGTKLETNTALWCIWDNFQLKYYGTEANIDQLKNAELLKEMQDLVAEAEAMKAKVSDETALAGLNAAIAQAGEATGAEAIQAAIDALNAAIVAAEKSRFYAFTGTAYIIDSESGLFMAAGHDWGTRGIVNEMGLDLIITANEETNKVTIDSRVSNGGNNHFLGSNLYMDSTPYEWGLEYQGFDFYISNAEGQYISLDYSGNLVMSETPHGWTIVTAEGVMAQRMEELAEATEQNPKDATFLIKANNFNRNDARNAEAWVVSKDCTNKNLSGGNNVNNCAESYHSTFTIMQTISGAPVGFYQLTAQGFYRQDAFEGEAPAAPVFFANEINRDVPALAEGGPNGMDTASEAFTNGDYTIEPITFEVKEDGMMYVGITTQTNTQWVIWDNFQLKYFGQNNPSTGISTVNVSAEQSNTIYNLAGQKVTKAQKGLYIINGKKQVVR